MDKADVLEVTICAVIVGMTCLVSEKGALPTQFSIQML